jgi:2,3-bisphosphoglycerate-dependent phosphoglycerate mutase
MGSKTLYFIRHGETISNAKHLRQGPHGDLSPRGREQVLETARRMPTGEGRPQVIISSTFDRARETAEIVREALQIPLEFSELLVERRNPSQIIGREDSEREVRAIVDLIDKGYHADDLRYSDEENFVDLRDRAKKLLAYIKTRREKRIVLVTHGIFLKMVISYMILRDSLTASEYNKLSYLNPMDNAGLTICRFVPHWLRQDEWKLVMWNDTLTEDA